MARRARPSACRNGSPVPNARKNALRLLAAQLISPCLRLFVRAGGGFLFLFLIFSHSWDLGLGWG